MTTDQNHKEGYPSTFTAVLFYKTGPESTRMTDLIFAVDRERTGSNIAWRKDGVYYLADVEVDIYLHRAAFAVASEYDSQTGACPLDELRLLFPNGKLFKIPDWCRSISMDAPPKPGEHINKLIGINVPDANMVVDPSRGAAAFTV